MLGKCELASLPRWKFPGARDFDNYLFCTVLSTILCPELVLGPVCQPIIKTEAALFTALLI